MEIRVKKKSGKVLLNLKGTLDGSTACEVEQVLQPLVEGGGTRLVVDFSGVGKVEDFGVVVFARVMKSQSNQFSEITFAGLRPSIQKVFRRLGFPFTLATAEDSAGRMASRELPSWQTS
jgi:anti-anti-sigma factor